MLVVNLYGLYFDQFPSLPSGTDLMTSIFGLVVQLAGDNALKMRTVWVRLPPRPLKKFLLCVFRFTYINIKEDFKWENTETTPMRT